jgi:hypothetical protein
MSARESSMSVADIGVAMHTVLHALIRIDWQQRVDKVFMARHAGALGHPLVSGLDLNRILEATERECQRVEESVVCFCDPFSHEVMRQVAIVANGHVMVARMLPGVHVVLHHMAIDTRLRIVTQVACAFAVTKRESSHA